MTDFMWDELHKHFPEEELVKLGYFVSITMGQQQWLRTMNVEHHQVLAGMSASMVQGFKTKEAMDQSRTSDDYWAKKTLPRASSQEVAE